jgi:hypothetical protein
MLKTQFGTEVSGFVELFPLYFATNTQITLWLFISFE